MNSIYSKNYSSALGYEVEMLSFGYDGLPLILFPTSMGHFTQYRDTGLIESASWFLDQGLVRIYCPNSFDASNLYNKGAAPQSRIENYLKYEKMVADELLPAILYDTGYNRLGMGGCSFGGYHAANLAFRHPDKVSYLFSMSGMFDIKSQLDGYYTDSVYFNNPVDYLPEMNSASLEHMGIALGTGEYDICLNSNEQLSSILTQKNVKHWLDIVPGANHDWPVWKQMLPKYLSQINISAAQH